MTGPQHWREADLILAGDADPCSYGCPHSGCPHETVMILRAIGHGLLATAAAIAFGGIPIATLADADLADEWASATGVTP